MLCNDNNDKYNDDDKNDMMIIATMIIVNNGMANAIWSYVCWRVQLDQIQV